MKQHCATLKSGCFNLAKRWCNVVSTSDTVLTLWNVENPTSDSVSFSTSHQLYFNVDQQHWKNVDLTLKLWLGSSIALKFETTVFLGLKRDFRVFRNSFGLPTLSESSSSENTYFFASIKCFALNLAFSYYSLSIWSLVFLNAVKSLSCDLSFSSTSPSNQFWVFPLTRLILEGGYCQWLSLFFQRSLNPPDWHLQNIHSLKNLFSSERFYKHQPRSS